MKRNVELKEISDGKLYGSNDLVKADCGDCEGCFACCCGMGQSIILDPLDVHRLSKGLNQNFEALLASYLELNVVDGIILPNLRMQGDRECCAFLNAEGRCKIHSFRPGICRLFPLGRYYEDGGFKYFLQIHECDRAGKVKVKVSKWIDTPDLPRYTEYINAWHDFQKQVQAAFARIRMQDGEEESKNAQIKQMCMYILNIMYVARYEENRDFYEQFEMRLEHLKELLESGI